MHSERVKDGDATVGYQWARWAEQEEAESAASPHLLFSIRDGRTSKPHFIPTTISSDIAITPPSTVQYNFTKCSSGACKRWRYTLPDILGPRPHSSPPLVTALHPEAKAPASSIYPACHPEYHQMHLRGIHDSSTIISRAVAGHYWTVDSIFQVSPCCMLERRYNDLSFTLVSPFSPSPHLLLRWTLAPVTLVPLGRGLSDNRGKQPISMRTGRTQY